MVGLYGSQISPSSLIILGAYPRRSGSSTLQFLTHLCQTHISKEYITKRVLALRRTLPKA